MANPRGVAVRRQRESDIYAARWPFGITSAACGDDYILLAIDHVCGGSCVSGEGQRGLPESFPVWLSKACILRSKMVAPMKTMPPAVTMGPP